MKKTITTLVSSLLLVLASYSSWAQITCNSSVFVSITPWTDNTEITHDMILEGNPAYNTVVVEPQFLYCSDIGAPVTVTVTLTDDNGTYSCWSSVTIEDKSGPIAVMDEYITRSLNDVGEYELGIEDFDNGSWDNCSEDLTFSFSQTIFTSADLGENTVYMTVEDEFGNSNVTFGTLNITEWSTQSLACNDMLYMSLDINGEGFLDWDAMLEGGPYNSEYEVEPSFFTCEDIGVPIVATVTDIATGNSCWGNVQIEDKLAPVAIAEENVIVQLTEDMDGNPTGSGKKPSSDLPA